MPCIYDETRNNDDVIVEVFNMPKEALIESGYILDIDGTITAELEQEN